MCTGIWGETVPLTEVTTAKALTRLNLPCTFEEQGGHLLKCKERGSVRDTALTDMLQSVLRTHLVKRIESRPWDMVNWRKLFTNKFDKSHTHLVGNAFGADNMRDLLGQSQDCDDRQCHEAEYDSSLLPICHSEHKHAIQNCIGVYL